MTEGPTGNRIALLTLLVTSLFSTTAYFHEQAQVEVANQNLKVAHGQLAAKDKEIKRIQQQSIDPVLLQISDFQERVEAETDDAGKALVIRGFAATMVKKSRSKTPPEFIDTARRAHSLSLELKNFPTKVDLSGISLYGLSWHGARLDDMILGGADLRAVNLKDGSLREAQLQDAHLQCVNLENNDVTGATFARADLSFANLRGVDLSAARGVKAGQLTGVDYDSRTQFPDTVDLKQIGLPKHYGGTRACNRTHILTAASQTAPQTSSAPSLPSPSSSSDTGVSPSTNTPPLPSPSSSSDTGVSPSTSTPPLPSPSSSSDTGVSPSTSTPPLPSPTSSVDTGVSPSTSTPPLPSPTSSVDDGG